MIPALLLGKIYSNSFLLALNSRMDIPQGRVRPAEKFDSALHLVPVTGSIAISVYVQALCYLLFPLAQYCNRQVTTHVEVEAPMA